MASINFQQQVYVTPAQAVNGDVADTSFLAEAISPVQNGYLADGNVTIGGFVWETNNGATVKSAGSGAALAVGYVPRGLNVGIIDDTTSGAGYVIPAGRAVKAYNRGVFYAVGLTTATAGQQVAARVADGALTFYTGSVPANHVGTGFYVKPLQGAATAPIGALVMITSQPTA